jgi:hypothetical protein
MTLSHNQKKIVRQYYEQNFFQIQFRKDGIYARKYPRADWMFLDTIEGAKKTSKTLGHNHDKRRAR